MSSPHQEQVDRNYHAFKRQLPGLLQAHRGHYALMRDETIVGFFDTALDAYRTGSLLYTQDGLFSIQEVTDEPVDLGIFSRLGGIR